jgi:hypothetical protein
VLIDQRFHDGSIALVFQGGQSLSVSVPLGVNLLPFAIQQLKATGTTAVGTFIGLW